MIKKRISRALFLASILCLLAGLVISATATSNVWGGKISQTDKWAWSTNAGWINFRPPNGGVTVYGDHLEGYAWNENVGWIRLGSYEGGGTHTYANTAAGNYGVNNDWNGNLSGYAWGTNAGWINFDPAGAEGVTVNPITGRFNGYAWGENIGWIHFRNNSSPAYNVVVSLSVGGDTFSLAEPGANAALWVALACLLLAASALVKRWGARPNRTV